MGVVVLMRVQPNIDASSLICQTIYSIKILPSSIITYMHACMHARDGNYIIHVVTFVYRKYDFRIADCTECALLAEHKNSIPYQMAQSITSSLRRL